MTGLLGRSPCTQCSSADRTNTDPSPLRHTLLAVDSIIEGRPPMPSIFAGVKSVKPKDGIQAPLLISASKQQTSSILTLKEQPRGAFFMGKIDIATPPCGVSSASKRSSVVPPLINAYLEVFGHITQ